MYACALEFVPTSLRRGCTVAAESEAGADIPPPFFRSQINTRGRDCCPLKNRCFTPATLSGHSPETRRSVARSAAAASRWPALKGMMYTCSIGDTIRSPHPPQQERAWDGERKPFAIFEARRSGPLSERTADGVVDQQEHDGSNDGNEQAVEV
jgi:hypothetical protein